MRFFSDISHLAEFGVTKIMEKNESMSLAPMITFFYASMYYGNFDF